jgi:hypothetical protein
MQKKFIIGTWWDPPFQFLPNRASFAQDLASFQTAREAHFNLLTATGGPPDNSLFLDSGDYRLELAAQAGLMSFAYGQFPPFDTTNGQK